MAIALTYWFAIDYRCKKFFSTIKNSLTYHNMYLITAKKVLLYSEHHASLLQHGIDNSPKKFYSIVATTLAYNDMYLITALKSFILKWQPL